MHLFSYDLPYNIYILIFGVYVSMRIACGPFMAKHWRRFSLLCPLLLLLQGGALYWGGAQTVRCLYPVITHLPLILLLVFREKCSWGVSLVSVAISYSICQLPRWVGLFLSLFSLSPAASAVIHIALSHLLLMLLDRFCLTPIHSVIRLSRRLLLSFGLLPALYYLGEYVMLYTHTNYASFALLSELTPTALVLFFVLFVIVYRQEAEKRAQAEEQMQLLQLELVQADQEIKTLRAIEDQTAICRHDLRHHLAMIDTLLSCGKEESALKYIREAQQQIDTLVPMRFCENETANLLLCAYAEKAKQRRISLSIKAELPQILPLSDTELCALLSNSLENALNAAIRLPDPANRTISVFFCIRQDNLLLEIKNPCQGEIVMEDGLPLSPSPGVHCGCRSIRSIALRRQGMCSFAAEGGIFTLRVVIPMKQSAR